MRWCVMRGCVARGCVMSECVMSEWGCYMRVCHEWMGVLRVDLCDGRVGHNLA